MYISIQNKKTRDFGRTEFAEICQENFLLIHAKNKYKDRNFARDTRSFYANDGGLFYMIIFSSDTPLF